jgi:hypothetical protein
MAKHKTTKKTHAANGRAEKPSREEVVENATILPLNRVVPLGTVGVCSNHFVVQHDGAEFHLSFFQTQMPIILGETEEEREQCLAPYRTSGVPSICVARIVVSAERMPAFIEAMQVNLGKYQAAQEAKGVDN